MSNKILNPVVLIHKRENSDSYAVAITSGSQDYRDAVLMAAMEPDMTGDNVDTWSRTGYYMAAEIERLRQHLITSLSIGELLQRLESQTGEKWEDASSADVKKDIRLLTVHRLNSGLFVNVTDIRGRWAFTAVRSAITITSGIHQSVTGSVQVMEGGYEQRI